MPSPRTTSGLVFADVLTVFKPLNTLVVDTATGMVARSTNSLAAGYAYAGGPVADGYNLFFGTDIDVVYTADGTNLVISQGAGAGATVYATGAPVDWGTAQVVRFVSDGANLLITQGAGLGTVVVGDNCDWAFGTGSDAIITPDGTDVYMTAGAGLWLLSDAGVIFVDPAATTQRGRLDCGDVTAGQTRVNTLVDMDVNNGGRFYSSVADSTTLTSLGAPTAFDVISTLGASTLHAGTVVKIKAVVRSISVNAADTLQYALRVGGATMVTSTALNVGADNRVMLEGHFVVRGAPGAAVEVSTMFQAYDGSAGAYTAGPTGAVGTAATNAAIVIDVLCTHSANNAGNQSVLESLMVEVD